jgi:hypothetical protein
MSEIKPGGILQYWQPFIGIIAFVGGAGMFYSKVQLMEKKLAEIENRQDRQFQLIQSGDKRVNDLEKESAYQKGVHEGRADIK